MVRVEIHRANMQQATRQAAARWAHRVGTRVTAEAKQRCPVDEGTLRASITHVVEVGDGHAKVTVGSPLPYAEYFHTGTGIYGPHATPIVPVQAKALKFRWDGPGGAVRSKDKRGWNFARSVKGMRPNPFLADALEAVMGRIRRT